MIRSLQFLFLPYRPINFVFYPAGCLVNYLSWLDHLHIGIASLLPTEYNRCRSDVKFLEYASHSVAPLLQDLDPYHYLMDTDAALLFLLILNLLIS